MHFLYLCWMRMRPSTLCFSRLLSHALNGQLWSVWKVSLVLIYRAAVFLVRAMMRVRCADRRDLPGHPEDSLEPSMDSAQHMPGILLSCNACQLAQGSSQEAPATFIIVDLAAELSIECLSSTRAADIIALTGIHCCRPY